MLHPHFTVDNWETNQRVTVSAGQDADAADDTANLTHRPSGGDYGSGQNKTFVVTVTDNDTRGVTVTPTSLMVNEGGTNTYTVVLDTEPTDTVTVTIVDPTANTDVMADPASLTFFTSDWDTEQTVTVSAAEDDDSTKDTATVTHTVSGGDYESFSASSVTVTVMDNDTPGVTVTPLSLTIDEGSTDTYTVALNTQPSGNVMVAIRSNNTDVTVSSSTLTFTTTDWNDEQTVTVTAGQDPDAANDMATLTHDPNGGGYNSVSNVRLMVTVTDDETAGVTVTPTSLMLTEGGSGMYTVVLNTQPTGPVTVTIIDPTDNTDVTANPASLRFTPTNWSTPRMVTVRAAQDNDSTQDRATVTHTVSGGDYGAVTAESVIVIVTDDDTPGITFSRQSLTVTEGGTSGSYTVRLTTMPTAEVTVEISSPSSPDVTTSGFPLTFTPANWNSAQTVTVTAVDDKIDEDAETVTLEHMASGGDYGSVTGSVTVTVNDNDTRGITITPTSLTVNEGGTNTYTIVLDTEPTDTVTVAISSNNTDVTVSSFPLTVWDNCADGDGFGGRGRRLHG